MTLQPTEPHVPGGCPYLLHYFSKRSEVLRRHQNQMKERKGTRLGNLISLMLIKTPMSRLTHGREVRECLPPGQSLGFGGAHGMALGIMGGDLRPGSGEAAWRRWLCLMGGHSERRGQGCCLRLREVQRRRCDARKGEGILSPAASHLSLGTARIFKSRGERISKEMSPPIPSPYRRRGLASLPDLAPRFLEKGDPIS